MFEGDFFGAVWVFIDKVFVGFYASFVWYRTFSVWGEFYSLVGKYGGQKSFTFVLLLGLAQNHRWKQYVFITT